MASLQELEADLGGIGACVIDHTFWQGKKVFLTGHTGFKGSWLSIWLTSRGARVTGYALEPPTEPSLFRLSGLEKKMTSEIGDIRDHERLRSALEKAAPEIVIHMAAQPLVRESYKTPRETYETNVMGTVNLFEAVRSTPSVRAVVNVTTDKCYENREWPWGYREIDPMGGYDPYSNSKGCSELVTAAYRSSFFNPADYGKKHSVAVASARAGNVIGGGDWAADRLVPDFFRAVTSGKVVRIRSPRAIRPWQHVLEPLSGYLALAQRLFEEGPKFAEGWNFGPEDVDAKPVEWMIRWLCSRWGEGASLEIDRGEHVHEASYLKLDISKARSQLDWAPRWNLERALDACVEWNKAYVAGQPAFETCLKQIRDYEERV